MGNSGDVVEFGGLRTASLQVDAVYRGGFSKGRSIDAVSQLLGVAASGGFRFKGSVVKDAVKFAVLYTTGRDPDWPDILDVNTGTFTYHGDQKAPGRDLHDTSGKGNEFLRSVFQRMHDGERGRSKVPPIFLFESTGTGHDVWFRGLLVPGSAVIREDEHLVAIWRSKGNLRFQNYRAAFTVLDVNHISRAWIDDMVNGSPFTENAPSAWVSWVRSGTYQALTADHPLEYRTRAEQLPTSRADLDMLAVITEHFSDRWEDFEACAAHIWTLMAPSAEITEVTRARVDGGRDAIGYYRLGPASDPIKLSFSLEAKCYGLQTAVGVKDVARLISRLRYREFGVLVTTSYVHHQTYREIRLDRHPVVVICGADIVRLLREAGYESADAVRRWLQAAFPS